MNTIVSRYIFREMIPPFLINLVVFAFIFLVAKILNITDLIVNHRVSASAVLLMLVYSTPSFMVYVVPMSVMMGVLFTFLRLSNDNEIIVLKAAGLSIYRLLPPVFIFCLIGSLATAFLYIYAAPRGRLSFKSLLFETAASNIDIGLKERAFNDNFNGVMLYVNEIDGQGKTLIDVFIEDRRNRGVVSTVVAPKGELFCDPEKLTYRLTLFDGIINSVDHGSTRVDSVRFDTYDFNLKLAQVVFAKQHGQKGRKEMSLAELHQTLGKVAKKSNKYYLTLMQYHKKFSIPFACFVFGLLAVPLGIQSRFTKGFMKMILGLFFFLIYYMLLSGGWILGEAGVCPPVIGMWVPNVAIGAAGVYLVILSANERPSKVSSMLSRIFMWQKLR